MKQCPNCNTLQSRENLMMCTCNEIICVNEQCRIEHALTSHLGSEKLTDEEWEELEN